MTPRERAEAEARALFVIEQHKDLGDVWWTVSRESTLVASAMSDAGAAARRDEHAAPIADAIERAILAALAEQAAGEAERVREAVAAEREDRERDHANHLDGWAACILADDERDALDARAIARDMRADAARIRARATSPAPEASAERAERWDAVPREVHESGWQWRPVDDDTAFAPPFGTVRVCIGCGCLVAGGPTRCVRCANESAARDGAER